jgi:hypothetical protein
MRAANAIVAVGSLVVLWTTDAAAVDFSFDGYIDARVVVPPTEEAWLDGGLGKLRYGSAQPDPNIRFAEAVGQGVLSLTPGLEIITVARIEPKQRSGVDVLESYLAWRPQASANWQWFLKAGAFFPTISVENDDLGWASPYTLTPSAINSWIGEELRTIGSEGILSFHSRWGTFSAIGALYCCNEPAGTVIAARGWALDDRPTGLIERLRLPDATIKLFGGTPPGRTGLFENIDGHVGWYGGLRWNIPDFGQVSVLRYDNNADAYAYTSRDSSWLTRFWSASIKTRIAGVTLLAQGLTGDTAIGGGGVLSTTYFDSAFLLASYDIDDWRISGRAETFETRNTPSFTPFDEDGHAFTGALIWNAKSWLRLSAELIQIDSRRGERMLAGDAAEKSDRQFQLGARFFF